MVDIINVVNRDPNSGKPLAQRTCSACPAGFYPNVNLSKCIPCDNPYTMIAVASGAGSTTQYTCTCKSGSGFNLNPVHHD